MRDQVCTPSQEVASCDVAATHGLSLVLTRNNSSYMSIEKIGTEG